MNVKYMFFFIENNYFSDIIESILTNRIKVMFTVY